MKKSLLGLGLILLLLMPGLAFAQKVTLEFVVWNYSLETIQDNISQFEAANPNINVKLTSYSWNTYHDTMVLRFKGKTKTDIMYNGEDWLPEFAAAGWVAPLEDYYPALKQYKAKTAGYALADMTYNGKVYGLSYYADLITFQYNKKLLKDFGVAAPKTWDDVWSGMEKASGAGIEKPFAYEYDATLPNFWSAYVSQVYGRGGTMFDAKLNPVFNDPKSEAFKQLQWLQDAKKKGYIAYYPHESKVAIGMNTGQHVYTVLYNYVLAEMNRAPSALAGQFDMVEMPGAAHGALGFAKFYCMTAQAAKDPARRNAAWKFIEAFGGGDYKVAKRWAVEKGLGFAALPLFDDPDVKAAWGGWIDMAKFKNQAKLAKNDVQTEWKGMWSQFFRPLVAKAINGDATVQEVMDQGATEWNNYKKLMGQ
jgi:multiple sugar transport system substrate-binding protein